MNLCTRHQYKYMYHIAGCRLHHEFILLLCQVSSIRQSSRFVSGRLWVQFPHLAPPFRFTPGRHGSQRRSSLGYAEGNLSVKSVGEINSLDALFWSNPQMLKQWQSSGTLPQNYSVCTFGQVTVHLAGFKAVFTAVLTRGIRHETIGGTSSWIPNTFPTGGKMGKSSGLRRVVSSGKYLSTYSETAKHVTGTSRVGCPFTRSNTQAGLRGVPAKDVGWIIPPRGFESHLLRQWPGRSRTI